MAAGDLNGLRVAILVADGFEQVEMTEPRKALDQAGAQTRLISPKDGRGEGLEVHGAGRRVPGGRPS